MTYSEGKMLTLQHFYFFLLHTLQVTIQNTVLRVKGKKWRGNLNETERLIRK